MPRKSRLNELVTIREPDPRTGKLVERQIPIRERILALIRAGNYIKHACGVCGISESTYREWEQKGREGNKQFAEFFDKLEIAKSEAACTLVARLNVASNNPGKVDVKAVDTLMRRGANKDDFRETVRVQVQDQIFDFMANLKRKLSPEIFAVIVDATNDWGGAEEP